MERILPQRLQDGDEIRIIAPSRSLMSIPREISYTAQKRLESKGLKVSFGKHAYEMDDLGTSSIKSRVDDLHSAFSDNRVKAVLTAMGGYNSNEILPFVDWDIIKNNPKVFCGYSDITSINNAIFSKTSLINYSGPHFSTFGQKLYFEYTLESFKQAVFQSNDFQVNPSTHWSDDKWFINQDDRKLITNPGHFTVNEGAAEGLILGGNLCTLNLLQGTNYFPDLTDSILFLEDYEKTNPEIFNRDIQSLVQQETFPGVRGIVIGRFTKESQFEKSRIVNVLKNISQIKDIPIIGGVDFGHTDPKITFPIGAICQISSEANRDILIKQAV